MKKIINKIEFQWPLVKRSVIVHIGLKSWEKICFQIIYIHYFNILNLTYKTPNRAFKIFQVVRIFNFQNIGFLQFRVK